MIHIVL